MFKFATKIPIDMNLNECGYEHVARIHRKRMDVLINKRRVKCIGKFRSMPGFKVMSIEISPNDTPLKTFMDLYRNFERRESPHQAQRQSLISSVYECSTSPSKISPPDFDSYCAELLAVLEK